MSRAPSPRRRFVNNVDFYSSYWRVHHFLQLGLWPRFTFFNLYKSNSDDISLYRDYH